MMIAGLIILFCFVAVSSVKIPSQWVLYTFMELLPKTGKIFIYLAIIVATV